MTEKMLSERVSFTEEKTLYLTDLDGTLLAPQGIVSDFTQTHLNALLDRGLPLSCATARTAASAAPILRALHFSLPLILLNGTCLYHLGAGRYESVQYLLDDAFRGILALCRDAGIHGFFHTVESDRLSTYYTEIDTSAAREYMEHRKKHFGKVFTPLSDFASLRGQGVVYFTYTNTKEALDPWIDRIRKIPHTKFEYYEDIYHPGFQYLEIFDEHASKYNAALALAKSRGFTRITAFGDHKNDLPLFAAANHCIAVENAIGELREIADEICPPNTQDGVCRWLMQNAKFEETKEN